MNIKYIVSLLIIILLFLSGCRTHDRQSFHFIQISDTHIGAPQADSNPVSFITCLNQENDKPDFIINTGDITDWGQENEWKLYDDSIKNSGLKFFNLLGNHDSRWSDNGTDYCRRYGRGDLPFEFNKAIIFIDN